MSYFLCLCDKALQSEWASTQCLVLISLKSSCLPSKQFREEMAMPDELLNAKEWVLSSLSPLLFSLSLFSILQSPLAAEIQVMLSSLHKPSSISISWCLSTHTDGSAWALLSGHQAAPFFSVCMYCHSADVECHVVKLGSQNLIFGSISCIVYIKAAVSAHI